MHIFQELNENQLRQTIDATSAYDAFLTARQDAKQVRGGMIWRTQHGKDYLIRTTPYGGQTSLGARSKKNEDIYTRFITRKEQLRKTLKARAQALETHQRLNRALRVGRMPSLVVDLLHQLELADLSNHFRVIGTFSLYAYESAAGVRLDQGLLNTNDVDLLWDVQKRIQFDTQLKRNDLHSMMHLLQKIDKTFHLRTDQGYTATNDQGFEVDILRRLPKPTDPHPIRLSTDEDDFWPVPASTGGKLNDAYAFSQTVIAATGRMAKMRTVHPAIFVQIKTALADSPKRDPLKRRRDRAQSVAVDALIESYLPHLTQPTNPS